MFNKTLINNYNKYKQTKETKIIIPGFKYGK